MDWEEIESEVESVSEFWISSPLPNCLEVGFDLHPTDQDHE